MSVGPESGAGNPPTKTRPTSTYRVPHPPKPQLPAPTARPGYHHVARNAKVLVDGFSGGTGVSVVHRTLRRRPEGLFL